MHLNCNVNLNTIKFDKKSPPVSEEIPLALLLALWNYLKPRTKRLLA